jgi:DNA-binding transcriptional LysR family regulator
MLEMNITGVDLNLLVVFDSLLQERNVSRAAHTLASTQPSVSRALNRLRSWFGDPLFVRSRRGVTPTERALELAPVVIDVVARARGLLRAPVGFDPNTCSRTFRVMTADYAQCTAFPIIIACLKERAPKISLQLEPWSLSGMRDALERGQVDLVLSPSVSRAPGLHRAHLFSDDFVTVVRSDHPTVGDRLSLRQYAHLSHLQVAPDGRPGGAVDDALQERRLERAVALRVPSFAAAPLIVASSDMVCTLPARVRDAYAALKLRTVSTPLRLGGFTLDAIWHDRADADPAHRWLRALMVEACSALIARSPTRIRRLNLDVRTKGTL